MTTIEFYNQKSSKLITGYENTLRMYFYWS
jgi:hypothetical protein